MNSPYQTFQTDTKMETEGVILDYGDYWIRVARAGGANKRYARRLEAAFKPYQRQIQLGILDKEIEERVFREVYADTIALGWGSKAHGEGQMIGRDGEAIPYSRENFIGLMTDLPEQFLDIRTRCQEVANFRAARIEGDAKN